MTATELEARLRAVVPAVRVVRERRLRRLLNRLADEDDPVVTNPSVPVWVAADRAAAADTVPAGGPTTPDGRVLLVSAPEDRFPADRPDAAVLRHYWRLLFRAAVADAVLAAVPDEAAARDRLAALGPAAALEIRSVLEADHLVPYDAPARVLLPAFVAKFLDLRRFDPDAVPWFFPTLSCHPDAAEGVDRDVPTDQLFAATRPDGAADAVSPRERPSSAGAPDLGPPAAGPAGPLAATADRAAGAGNYARAAILRTRAARGPHRAHRDAHRAAARSAVRNGLVKRLAAVLGWDAPTADAWAAALDPLLPPASSGVWPHAARALYDLQRVVTDLSGELVTVDPIEWVRTFGRRPLRRPLTRARPVVLLRHLQSAAAHVQKARVSSADRGRLDRLLAAEVDRASDRVAAELGPVIRQALEAAGLRPANVPERVAKDKLVAELLDRICARGFLRFADLRDAVARNQLKLPDLAGPGEWVRGDPLLRADARLAEDLDGVYRRAEVYLRLMQRGTAAAFGTRVGRWLALTVVFPFGGALMAVEFAKYVRHEGGQLYHALRRLLPHAPDDPPLLGYPPDEESGFGDADWESAAGPAVAPPDGPPVSSPAQDLEHGASLSPESLAAAAALGVAFLLLIRSPAVRAVVWAGLAAAGRGLRFMFVTLPQRAWRSPAVRAVRHSAVTGFLVRHFGAAGLAAALVALDLVALGSGLRRTAGWAGVAFAAVGLVVQTPPGRWAVDRSADALADGWRTVRANLIPGVLSWVAWVFREVSGRVERGLYAVDEWFRFRPGRGDRPVALTAALAALWFPVAYLFRFAFYLLLEPQLNPLKHFPVVTVSHKLILPQVGVVADLTGLSIGAATLLLSCVPGVFGFIAWELKENWRLYAASRSARPPRVVLGHHGETMRGLLRPGFHSGTVPKLFAKLRAAVRRADRTGDPPDLDKPRHGLDDVRHAVTLFVDRELVPLLRSAASWRGLTPQPGPVHLGNQTVAVELAVPELGEPNLRLAFDHHAGTITARSDAPGWVGALSPDQRDVLRTAVAGFCEMACADPPPGCEPATALTWDGWVTFWDRAGRGRREYR